MTRSLRFNTSTNMRVRIYAFILLVLVAIFVVQLTTHHGRAPFTSAEVQFSDASAHGMQIIPASCPSNPHYTAECDPACTIAVSPASVVSGNATTLYWSNRGFPDGYAAYGSGLFATVGSINGVGAVNPSGAVVVAPGVSTTYTYSGTYYFYPQYYGYSYPFGSFSCSTTLTVTTPPPTCTITLTPASVAYGSSATLSYSSTDTSSFYISNIGYVAASGSTTVGPGTTTTYSGSVSGAGGSGSCTKTLTVTPPATPSASITASSTAIYVGQSTGIKATFSASSNDTLTHDNIDSPVGTGLGATTNPDATKYYTFTPSSAGTYTFYARAQTSYYPSWTTYNSVVVTVTAAPSCTVSLSPTSIAQGGSATLSYSSTNATAFSISNVGSLTPNTSGSTTVSPSSSTNYTGTATAGGVTSTCTASGTSPVGTLAVSCTPTYACSTNTIQYTNASCAVSSVATCTAPAFCSAGSSVCLYPPPAYSAGTGSDGTILSGHLQIAPSLVPQGLPSKIYWSVSNVASCTVSGTNGDSWSAIASGSSGKITASIQQQTTYTLSCVGLDGSPVHESVTINVVPIFIEK